MIEDAIEEFVLAILYAAFVEYITQQCHVAAILPGPVVVLGRNKDMN